ncbi:sugar ABC transporter substrate-binding protein [Kineococcus sp. SYSU DK003]|uniref:sugar ABC transporter substrate-binding protein n=1 Tax=Kineococcus sp. SYSU DK003 TaxID=3383124 RepID=UPI003D7E38CB
MHRRSVPSPTRRRGLTLAAAVCAASLSLAACGSGSDAAGSEDGTYRIAVMIASAGNGFNAAVLEGAEAAAAELGNVEISSYDGQFDSDEQFAQIQNIATSGDFDGIVVVPNDGVSLTGAFPLASPLPVVTLLNPVGPDISDMEPQVEEVVQTIAQPPADPATKQAEEVVDHCADIDPCKVAIMVGQLNTALDVERADAYNAVLEGHDNIQVVATVEGKYDRDASLTAMTNVLQANPDLDAVLSNADQQTFGAEVAFENAGIDPSTVHLSGGGGTQEAVTAVREGRWKWDYLNFPVSMGSQGVKSLVEHLDGTEVPTYIDMNTVSDVEAFATKETLDASPDFTGEWNG